MNHRQGKGSATAIPALRKPLLGQEGGKRGCPPSKVESRLRGDIDWIVMKCLEKDRNHRYDTANVLAQDLRAFSRCRSTPLRATSDKRFQRSAVISMPEDHPTD